MRDVGRGVDHAVIGRAAVVLDLFERDDVRRLQVVQSDLGEACVLGRDRDSARGSRR